jgi:hypothetical protein
LDADTGGPCCVPLDSDPNVKLGSNTTSHLIADIEMLRVMRGVELNRTEDLKIEAGPSRRLDRVRAIPNPLPIAPEVP